MARPRLTLRRFRGDELVGVAAWLDGSLLKLDAELPLGDRRYAVDVEGDEKPAGLVVYCDPRRGVGRILLVALRPEVARRGFGQEAALLVERRLVAEGARRIEAAALGRHGLSLYFWLRLGYRPLPRGPKSPKCNDPDVVWMCRDVSDAGS